MSRFLILVIIFVALSGCASDRPTIDRVQKVREFVVIPDKLFSCPDAPILSEQEIELIQTETDYNERYVLPLYEARNRCAQSLRQIRILNDDAIKRNAEMVEKLEE